MPPLTRSSWCPVVLDEALAIKNPNAKQTKAAKALNARVRIALTGTPVENHLGDLWSIFDFINPGLLGTAKQFTCYTKGLADRVQNPYGPSRDLVRPYILRRMKTDKTVIADLPDKTEITAHCNLSRKQAALYGRAVSDLAKALEESDGIQRRGIVLASLMRLKQICNHPSQWLNDGVCARRRGAAEAGADGSRQFARNLRRAAGACRAARRRAAPRTQAHGAADAPASSSSPLASARNSPPRSSGFRNTRSTSAASASSPTGSSMAECWWIDEHRLGVPVRG
jgi:SNF2 family DNA or RNA helicase